MFRKTCQLVAACLTLTTMNASAGTITIGSTAVAAPDRIENFDVGALGNNVSDQFASSGLTFVTLSGTGIALTSNAQCGNFGRGVENQYLYMGLNYPCVGSTALDAVSIQFAQDVSELSWTGFNRAINLGFNIQALLDGVIVSSTNFNGLNQFENQTVLLTGSVFDELRFSENGTFQGFFALDNFRWTTANASPVPEPTSLLLFGTGAAALAAKVRRRKAS